MPSIAKARVENDLPPGVPLTAMGALPVTDNATIKNSPAVSRINTLLDAARQRTMTLFGAAQPPAAPPPSPRVPAPPTLGTMRTQNLEGGLDSLEARSTTPAVPQPAANPIPNPLPTAMGGTQAFDYRAYLNEMGKRDIGGK